MITPNSRNKERALNYVRRGLSGLKHPAVKTTTLSQRGESTTAVLNIFGIMRCLLPVVCIHKSMMM